MVIAPASSASEAEARAIYLANYQPGGKGLGAITALPMAEFREWLANHDTRLPMASNRVPPGLEFMKADVENPGSRGGHFYVDHQGASFVRRRAPSGGRVTPRGRGTGGGRS